MSTSAATRKSAASVNRLFEIDEQPAKTQAVSPIQIQPAKSRVSAGTIQAANEASLNEADILRLLAEYDAVKTQAKILYARKDQIEAMLLDVLHAGDQVAMADGRTATIVDNFDCIDKKTGKKRNKVWAPAGVCRFEIEITGVSK